MDTIVTIIIVVLGLALTAFLIFVEDAFEKITGRLLSPLFRAVGLKTGSGPLVGSVEERGDRVVVTLENRGRGPLRLGAVEGRDSAGKRCYPVAYSDASTFGSLDPKTAGKAIARLSIEAGASQVLLLDPKDLANLGCRTLAMIDADGRLWPVSGSVLA